MDPRIDYIKSHPEIKHLTTMFIAEIIYSQPEDIREFGKLFFAIPEVKNFAARLAGFDSYDHHMKFIVNQQLKSLMDSEAAGQESTGDGDFQSGAQILHSLGREEAESDARMNAIINNMRLSRAQTQITEQITKEQANLNVNKQFSNNVSSILNVGRIPQQGDDVGRLDVNNLLGQGRLLGRIQAQLSNQGQNIYIQQENILGHQTTQQGQYGQQFINQGVTMGCSANLTMSTSQTQQQINNIAGENLTINQLQYVGNQTGQMQDVQIYQDGVQNVTGPQVNVGMNALSPGQPPGIRLITDEQLNVLKQFPPNVIQNSAIVAMVLGQNQETQNFTAGTSQINLQRVIAGKNSPQIQTQSSQSYPLTSDSIKSSTLNTQNENQKIQLQDQHGNVVVGKLIRLDGALAFIDEKGQISQLVGVDGTVLTDQTSSRLGPGQLEQLLINQAGLRDNVVLEFMSPAMPLPNAIAVALQAQQTVSIPGSQFSSPNIQQGQYQPNIQFIQGQQNGQTIAGGQSQLGQSGSLTISGIQGIPGQMMITGGQMQLSGSQDSQFVGQVGQQIQQQQQSSSVPLQPGIPGMSPEDIKILQENAAKLGRLSEFGRQGVNLSKFSDLGVSVVFTPTFQELGSDFQRAAVYQIFSGHLARSPRVMRSDGYQINFKQKLLFQPDILGVGVAEYVTGLKTISEQLPGSLLVLTNISQEFQPWISSQLRQLRGASRGIRWLAGRFNVTNYDGVFKYIPLIFKGNYAKGSIEDFCMILTSFVAPSQAEAKLEATFSGASIPEVKRGQIRQREVEELAEKAKQLNKKAQEELLEYLIQQSQAKAIKDKRNGNMQSSSTAELMSAPKSSSLSAEKLRQAGLDYADFSDLIIDIRELNRFITQQKQQIQAQWLGFYQQKNAVPQSQLPEFPKLDSLRYDNYFYEPYSPQYEINDAKENINKQQNNQISSAYNQLLFPVHQLKIKGDPILSDDHKGIKITSYVVQQILGQITTNISINLGCENRNIIEEVQCMLKEVNITVNKENIFVCNLSSQQVFNYRDHDRNQTAIIRVNSQSQVYSNPFLYYEAVWQYGRISHNQQLSQSTAVQSTKANMSQSLNADNSNNPIFSMQNQYIQKRFFEGRVVKRGFINSQIYMSIVNFKNIERREETMTLVNNCIPDIPIDGSYITQQHYINPIISMLIQLQFETTNQIIDFQAISITYFQQISQLVILKAERHLKHVTNYLLQTLLQRLIFKVAERKDLDIYMPTLVLSHYSLYNLSILESQIDNFFNQPTNSFLDAVFVPNIHQYNCKAAFPSWYEDTAKLWLVQMTVSDLKTLLRHFRDYYSFDRLVRINIPFRPLCGSYSLVDDKLVNQDLLKLKLLQRMIVSADSASINRQSLETNYNVVHDEQKLKEDISSSYMDESQKKPISVIVDQFLIDSVLWRDVADKIKLKYNKMVDLNMRLCDIAIVGKTEDVGQLYFGL